MNLGLEGKRALVLGASKGIGRGIAQGLADEGARVAVASRTLGDRRPRPTASGRARWPSRATRPMRTRSTPWRPTSFNGSGASISWS